MKQLGVVGEQDASNEYIDRPTVKVVICKDDKILILNDGLLPGGGVEDGETDEQAIKRELLEELGVSVNDVREIGIVIQYRNFIRMKYIVRGYVAQLENFNSVPNPQDSGEAEFIHEFLTQEQALLRVGISTEVLLAQNSYINSDTFQGKLYNLQTTNILIKNI